MELGVSSTRVATPSLPCASRPTGHLTVVPLPTDGLPLGVGFAEEVGPGEGGAAAVGAMDDDDFCVGKGDAVIEFADGGVVPLADLAEIDAGENLRREAEVLTSLRKMVDGDDGADDGRELEYFDGHLGHVSIRERDVGGGEGDLVVVELLDACLGADAVVGDVDVGMVLPEGLNPSLIEWGGEGGASGL